jgi:hypothetical protein
LCRKNIVVGGPSRLHNGAGLRDHAFHWTGDAWHANFVTDTGTATLHELAWTMAVFRSILLIRLDGRAWPGQSIYYGERRPCFFRLWPDRCGPIHTRRSLVGARAPDSDSSRRQSVLQNANYGSKRGLQTTKAKIAWQPNSVCVVSFVSLETIVPCINGS